MRLRPSLLAPLRRTAPRYARCFGHFTSGGSASAAPAMNIPMPYIEETTAQGRRTWDIFSKLLQERIICVNGEINDYMSASVVSQLLWLESDTPDKPITMYINSPGGSVTSGMAIYDTMSYIKSPVSTVCVGGAASMAAILLAGGEPGKRCALPHSSIMIHQPLGGTHGQASDILIYANQIQRIREQSNRIMRHHLNTAKGFERYSLEEINDLMERDKYLSTEEALELGVIDEIFTKRTDKDGPEEAGNKDQSRAGESKGSSPGESPSKE
ncbi:ATP-dependent Clp protease proteolytic subunit [Emericellopsis atlantica]|uniref:ATP-dependent Clp protease proteolytic subunit n=1 Tax=Emericellopsis atlantica TaxID=2614577 RepID=A0A9P8CMT1_9HYPO|nr:ATP-dependent Clp protease proteolytic subunit [Emericellopsis atlantica]KAG9253034.1 ATP-dependent Clp protease proteolytic subunit [Emericellopsis atlantica]